MDKKLSVIVPVYNAKDKIERCAKSILDSTYIDIEVILIDDGSTDGSGVICDAIAKKYKNIVAVHKENGGQASARNVGLEMATGDYITFVDDDDVIDSTMYSVLIRNAELFDVEISGCSTLMVYDNGKRINGFPYRSGYRSSQELINNILYQNKKSWGSVWNKVFKKELWSNVRFPEGCEWEDYYVIINILCKVSKVYFDERPLYHWYHSSESQSKRPFHRGLLSGEQICNHIEDLLLSSGNDYSKSCRHFRFCIYLYILEKASMSDNEEQLKEIVLEYLHREDKLVISYFWDKKNSIRDYKRLIKFAKIKCHYFKNQKEM